MYTQISSRLLDETAELDLSNVTDPMERMIRMMDAMIQWERVEALGWWEHTSDWDLQFIVELNDGTRHDLTANPGYFLVIDGKPYKPWDLLEHATELPVIHNVPHIEICITDAMVYEGPEDMDGSEITISFDLTEIRSITHTAI